MSERYAKHLVELTSHGDSQFGLIALVIAGTGMGGLVGWMTGTTTHSAAAGGLVGLGLWFALVARARRQLGRYRSAHGKK